jgi:Asp/Glu/Hydantoin racemase
MRTVGFLHTSPVHVDVFERLVAEIEPGARCTSAVDEGLLAMARHDGPGAADVVAGVAARIDELIASGADQIVCTCSTIGGIAELVGAERGMTVVRVDRAMAERAVEIGGRVLVLAVLESTLEPTTRLIAAVAGDRHVEIETHLVDGAWAHFEAGDVERFHALIADAIERIGNEADVIVLAQASMAGAATRVAVGVPVLSSPRLAVEHILRPA